MKALNAQAGIPRIICDLAVHRPPGERARHHLRNHSERAILVTYVDLDHSALPKTVYASYPACVRKRRLPQGRRPSG